MSDYIFILAVLRAAIEGVHLGTYFGSTVALRYWREKAQSMNLITSDGKATKYGRDISDQLLLTEQEQCRAYLWRQASVLEKKAQELIGE